MKRMQGKGMEATLSGEGEWQKEPHRLAGSRGIRAGTKADTRG